MIILLTVKKISVSNIRFYRNISPFPQKNTSPTLHVRGMGLVYDIETN
jgi:hypothetical protein